jgi:hypothetical protein
MLSYSAKYLHRELFHTEPFFFCLYTTEHRLQNPSDMSFQEFSITRAKKFNHLYKENVAFFPLKELFNESKDRVIR